MGLICKNCGGSAFTDHGSGKDGSRRYKCKGCGYTTGDNDKREKISIRERYLILLLSETLSTAVIADIFGVTRQRIHSIIKSEKKKLEDKILDDAFDKEDRLGKVSLAKIKNEDIIAEITKKFSSRVGSGWIFLRIPLNDKDGDAYLLKFLDFERWEKLNKGK